MTENMNVAENQEVTVRKQDDIEYGVFLLCSTEIRHSNTYA